MEHQSIALHSFHLFAVKDRCNTFSLTDNPAFCETSNCDLTTVLPTIDNDKISHGNASVLAARIIRKRFKFFAESVDPVTRHITHKYSKEMSQKTEVVSRPCKYIVHLYLLIGFFGHHLKV